MAPTRPDGPIPPNADLDFDVKVVKVVPNAAAMMQRQARRRGGAQRRAIIRLVGDDFRPFIFLRGPAAG